MTELADMCDRVGIIEQGCLLATGSVDEIQRGQAQHRGIVVRILGNTDALTHWLDEHAVVSDLVVDGELVRFSHEGDREAEALMLKGMVEAGLSIAEFSSHQK